MPIKNQEEYEIRLASALEELEDLLSDFQETLRLGKLNLPTVIDPASLSLFTARRSRVDSAFEKFLKAYSDAKYCSKLLTKDCNRIDTLKTSGRDIYYEILSLAHSNTSADDTLNNSSVHPDAKSSARLPIIPLPQFCGDIASWPSFKDTYMSLVHTNADLDAIQKFHYLKSSLKDAALQTISRIPLTSADYNQAWAALTKRYDNKRILATHHLVNIFNFKQLSRPSLSNLQQFCAVVLESAEAFRTLALDDAAGFILYTFALRLLDTKTKEKFENQYGQSENIPSFSDFANFIHEECLHLQTNALTATSTSTSTALGVPSHPSRHPKHVFMSLGVSCESKKCPVCQSGHLIYECPTFQAFSPPERYQKIKALNRCFNCFASGHSCRNCPSSKSCRHCKRRHHSLLHFFATTAAKTAEQKPKEPRKSSSGFPTRPNYSGNKVTEENKPRNVTNTETIFSSAVSGESNILLGTALARIQDTRGGSQTVRILIDSGSQRSFITSSCTRRLSLCCRKGPQRLVGLGNQEISGGNSVAECILHPQWTETPKLRTKAIVIERITGQMPVRKVNLEIKNHLVDLDLADPCFDEPGPIDFLLGADLFGSILIGGATSVSGENTHAIKTIFGHILLGEIPSDPATNITSLFVQEKNTEEAPGLTEVMSKFWEVEEVPTVSRTDPEDIRCEEFFVKTHFREKDGRYVVKLPFKANPPNLESSKKGALHRLHKLEQRFSKNTELKNDYSKVLQEYIDKGYMTPAIRPGLCFLPHHGVTKESTSTKLRVVFDASFDAGDGSLNGHLMTGPKLQQDIKDVLIYFRVPRFAMATDVCQMYLQILLDNSDRPYQHLFYRFDSEKAVVEYELNRLTFGMSCSPYLALRVIQQLLDDEGDDFPLAKRALTKNIYMDDILTGADTLEEALQLQTELVDILGLGGFTPKKWSSNSDRLLENLPADALVSVVPLSNLEDAIVKILGLQWEPQKDCLSYKIQTQECRPTKRGILSTIARMYDPVGYLAPVTFRAKCLMQRLWEQKLEWDEPVAEPIRQEWYNFFRDLNLLSNISIPRCIFPEPPKDVQVIGFADASSHGYAAVIYLRVEMQNGQVFSHLINAKTRLAPLKPLSIPRLELCAALLLISTMNSLKQFFSDINVSSICLLSDSSTVLSWLKLPFSRLKVFVANRVAKILDSSSIDSWFHVPSEHNGADIASRGLEPSLLPSRSSWWAGPEWIVFPRDDWPLKAAQIYPEDSDIPETRVACHVMAVKNKPNPEELLEKFSSYPKMLRVLAYAYRFKTNLGKDPNERSTGPVTLTELNHVEQQLLKAVQDYHFLDNLPVDQSRSNKLKALAPFFDPRGLLRVGGRLANAPIDYESKHPILLPTKSRLTTLIVDHLHLMYLHAGPQLLQSLVRRRYWIPSARRVIRTRVHKCLKCHRLRVAAFQPFMADLPVSRFEQGRPFINTGVDFAGPLTIKESLRRKAAQSKAYVCLFICMATKAVHVEIVSSLSSEAFLATLDRFIARRGIPSKMFSDNGKNFVGAKSRLQELWGWWRNEDTRSRIENHLTSRQIRWEFIPPAAPHFGGLWEAGIKSFKYHLTRILEGHPLTFEELSTVAARIEAVLNSRPLYPMSSSVDDFSTLTPGHFLIGAPLLASPERDWSEKPMHLLSRWQFLQKCIGDFWKKWKSDYLTTLQNRVKWTNQSLGNVSPGTMVLLRDPATAPSFWPVGRVLETYPGNDHVIRVVKIKTPTGEYVRPLARLAPLFPEGDTSQITREI